MKYPSFFHLIFSLDLANFRVSDYNELYLPSFGTEARRTVRERRHMPLLPATTSHTLACRPATATRGSLSPSDCTIVEWALLWRAGRDGARWLSFVWWPANRSFNQTHRIGATAALARRARMAAVACCTALLLLYSFTSMYALCLLGHSLLNTSRFLLDH